jgi:hypothetical protein
MTTRELLVILLRSFSNAEDTIDRVKRFQSSQIISSSLSRTRRSGPS